MAESCQYCTFQLEESSFGIGIERVQEVIGFQEITPVPLASAEIAGLINLRGQIVPALDLRRCFEMAPRPAAARPGNVVVRAPEGAVSLLVDRIGDVLSLEQAQFERPPETLRGRERALIRGAYKLPDRLLLVLDIDRVLQLGAAA
jgi:purine-binding chemotaxis protein CheW